MKAFLNKNKYILLVLSISLIAYFRWASFSIFAYSDYMFQFSDTLKEMSGFSSWESFGMGNVNILPWRLFGQNNLAFGLFGILGFDSNIADKFLIMWPWVILSGLGSYLLIKKITKSEIGGVIGSFVFSFNTYFLAINTQGHLLLSIASALSVFSLLFFIKLLEEKKLYLIILTAFSLFLTGTSDFRILYLTIWIIFFYYIFYMFYHAKKLHRKNIPGTLKLIVLPIILLILLNFYWLASSISSGALIDNSVMNRTLFGSSFFSLSRAATLFHPFWENGKINWFVTTRIPFYFWAIPILSILGLVLNRKNKDILFFGFIALLGVFLSKQIDEPFGNVYRWLFARMPGFDAFREASKFYLLTSIGYSVLIGYFVAWLWKKQTKIKWQVCAKYFLTFLIALLFLWNTKPIITGEIESMFAPRDIPNDYRVYKDFIAKQSGSFRTLWMPNYSRWTFYNSEKRSMSAVGAVGNDWKQYVASDSDYDSWPKNEQIISILKNNSSHAIFNRSSIRYIAVPTKDAGNDTDPFYYYGGKENPEIRKWYISELNKIDWLRKINIGTKELVIYENKSYNPHFFALDHIYNLNSLANLNDKAGFITNTLGNASDFILMNDKNTINPLTSLRSLYEDINTQNIENNPKSTLDDVLIGTVATNSANIFSNSSKRRGYYSFDNAELKLYTNNGSSLSLNGRQLINDQAEDSLFFRKNFESPINYIDIGGHIVPIEPGEKKNLSLNEKETSIKIYSSGENIITNSSFEDGPWQEKVGDCNKYDDNPILSMDLDNQESSDGEYSLRLEATRHIACVNQKFYVTPGEYALSFDYQSPNSDRVGFYLQFDNQNKTIISGAPEINNEKWNSFLKKITVPNGSQSATLYLYAYPSDGQLSNIARYDNFRFSPIVLEEDIAVAPPKNNFENMGVTLEKTENVFSYKEDGYDYRNIFPNGSFEQGSWTNTVNDCYNFDDNPSISMRLNTEQKTQGSYSLELSAKNHIACTNIPMQINEGSTYLLSFDYQGDAIQAGYYISFDDSKKTTISEKLPIKGGDWIPYSKRIKTPVDASGMRIYIYAYQSDGREENIVHYDNFKLIEVPDLENRFYLLEKPNQVLKKPAKIAFTSISPTKKGVHIKGASTPFFLSMSEAYHKDWQLRLGDRENYQIDEKYHYNLNGFLNAWYVNTQKLCEVDNDACSRNKDGTYDMEMVVEFWPQRWFMLGLFVSIVTFLSCFSYLIYLFRQRGKVKNFRRKGGKNER